MSKPTVAVSVSNPERCAWWVDHLSNLLPEHHVQAAHDVSDPDSVGYAVVWKPPTGQIAGWPRLKAVVSVGAGIDHIAADVEFPVHIPVVKTVGPDMTQRMCEYVALHVLRMHRALPELQAAQKEHRWHQVLTPPAPKRKVGIMGMGHLGSAAAETLRDIGFDVAGWSLSGSTPDGVAGYDKDRLDAFLIRSEILVCLIPLTAKTIGILNADLFAKLPKNACVINAARGEHLMEDDLLDALNGGQISQATLDVFKTEPLPQNHPFWDHPRVLVTPHLASLIDPVSGGEIIAKSILNLEANGHTANMTQINKGY